FLATASVIAQRLRRLAVFNNQSDCDGGFGRRKVRDVFLHAIDKDREVALLEIQRRLARLLVVDNRVDVHEVRRDDNLFSILWLGVDDVRRQRLGLLLVSLLTFRWPLVLFLIGRGRRAARLREYKRICRG